MKLLGRRNRVVKGKEKSNFSPSKWANVASPDRRSSSNRIRHNQKQRYPSNTDSPINLALQQNVPKEYHRRQNGRSQSSTIVFTQCGNEIDDNNTLDGNQSLYNWSVSDNAPSIGSAAHLFDDENEYPSRKKNSIKRYWAQGVRGKLERNKTGNISSSDDDDDDHDDFDDSFDNEVHDFTKNQNFQYAMLSDSPPPKSLSPNGTKTGEEITPKRKVGNRGNAFHSQKVDRNKISPYPTQKENSSSGERSVPVDVDDFIETKTSKPVDVDEFIGIVTPCNAEGKSNSIQHCNLPAGNSKGKFKTNGNSDSLPLPPGVKASIIRTISLEESVDADAEFNALYDSTESTLGDTAHASMRNLVDSNSPYAKRRSKSAGNSSPGLKNETKSFGCYTNNGSMIEKDWTLTKSNGKDILWKKRQKELKDIESEIENDSYSPRKEKSKKNSITNQMKKKLHSIVGTKAKPFDSKKKQGKQIQKKELSRALSDCSMRPLSGTEKCGNHIPKANLSRSLSEFSMNPLTGIEKGFVKGNKKSRKEIVMEMQRRKIIERREIERKEREKQLKLEQAQKLEQHSPMKGRDDQMRENDSDDAHEKLNESTSEDAACFDQERQTSKGKLDQWVKGLSSLNLDDNRSDPDHSNELQSNYSSSKLSHGAITTRIDNTSGQSRVVNTRTTDTCTISAKESFSFETSFPDEGSTQTPHSPQIKTDFSCVVCHSSERTHLATPCMHFSYCEECVNVMRQKGRMKCVVCNESVSVFSKVFF